MRVTCGGHHDRDGHEKLRYCLTAQGSPFSDARKFHCFAQGMCNYARMDWQDVRHFVALARLGSFSAAARELRVDHATVGRRVAALEASLDVRLLDRLPRRALLTDDGRAIAALGASMEDAAVQIERRARGAGASPAATVRVSASPAVAARLIAPRVARFHEKNPAITLVLSGVTETVAMDRGEADLAVRLSQPKDPELVAHRIGIMRFGLYASPDQAKVPPESWRFIAYDAPLDNVPQQVWLKSLLVGRPIIFHASDLFGQQEAARAGMGAVVLPCFMGDVDTALVRLPTSSKPPVRDIWLATYPDLKRSAKIRSVMDFLRGAIELGCPRSEQA
ncbi:LysR family transcriptional regulator [Lichenifustis flavocetrariae]|uniref:LysR family transcriptional regulator n=1 Tax=Lichenifustis flavocetrariae TaxID=2949735 RepID=A0AA42CKL0_9HYPH|nr:LysR family transcriptional regulator [Lichenifustis flavocetrariae]MCW6510669.1 LysR family transcriptional regulator [Lichenifustis flavocetrariae]